MSTTAGSGGLRLPAGQVTVLLGPAAARRSVVDRLDGGSARCGRLARGIACVSAAPGNGLAERLEALSVAGAQRPSVVVVNRLTDGLTAAQRRTVLAELRTLATAGPAVLVDDADPVAALSVADAALRAGTDGSLCAEELGGPERVEGLPGF